MRRYETIYILRPTMSEDEVTAVIENTNAILSTDGGQVISIDKWGLRTLAYLINKESQGYYVFCDYATNPANVEEMERKFRIDEAVMKYMTVKVADSITDEGVEAARGEYQAAIVAAEEAEKDAEKQEEKKPDASATVTETVKEEVKEEKEEVKETQE
ncbi:MAG: 30S ribosomal protein S6 [Thermodesulfobacteriota bacterium]|nr:30S ribosomal protein S6 [Thermodesulfobacteriota bacterium]